LDFFYFEKTTAPCLIGASEVCLDVSLQPTPPLSAVSLCLCLFQYYYSSSDRLKPSKVYHGLWPVTRIKQLQERLSAKPGVWSSLVSPLYPFLEYGLPCLSQPSTYQYLLMRRNGVTKHLDTEYGVMSLISCWMGSTYIGPLATNTCAEFPGTTAEAVVVPHHPFFATQPCYDSSRSASMAFSGQPCYSTTKREYSTFRLPALWHQPPAPKDVDTVLIRIQLEGSAQQESTTSRRLLSHTMLILSGPQASAKLLGHALESTIPDTSWFRLMLGYDNQYTAITFPACEMLFAVGTCPLLRCCRFCLRLARCHH
jgi:hypothetical protein